MNTMLALVLLVALVILVIAGIYVAIEVALYPLHITGRVTLPQAYISNFSNDQLVFSPICLARNCNNLPAPTSISINPDGTFSYNKLSAGDYEVTMNGCNINGCATTFPFHFSASLPTNVTLNITVGVSAATTNPKWVVP